MQNPIFIHWTDTERPQIAEVPSEDFLQRCQLGDFADFSGNFPEPPWRFQTPLATNLESRSDLSRNLDETSIQ